MFGEGGGEKKEETEGTTTTEKPAPGLDVAELEVEIRRGPAPDTSKKGGGAVMSSSSATYASSAQDAHALAVMKAAEAAAIAAG
jgi:ATP-dependent RNA helicase DDX46/PRP5